MRSRKICSYSGRYCYTSLSNKQKYCKEVEYLFNMINKRDKREEFYLENMFIAIFNSE